MAENFVIKTKNGEDWDILHPETNMGQVIGLQDRLETLEELPAALTAVESMVDALETDVTTIKEDVEALVASDMTAHNTSETAHSDIRTALTSKADLVDGKILNEQLPEGASGEALIEHNTSETAHGDIREALEDKADLVDGKVPLSQLPEDIDSAAQLYGKLAESSSGLSYDGNLLAYKSDIPATYDASRVVGKLDASNFPDDILNRLIKVATKAEKFALTSKDAQVGDTVLQLDNGVMYYVVDDSKLHIDEGYQEYAAGFAYDSATLNGVDASEYATNIGVVEAIGEAIGLSKAEIADEYIEAIDWHDTDTESHADIRGMFNSKADLVNGRIPVGQMPEEIGVDAVTHDELEAHDTSGESHGDIRDELSLRATLVGGRVPVGQLPEGVTINGLVASDMTAHNTSETAHSDIRTALTSKADLVDGKILNEQLPEGVSGEALVQHNVSETAHADIRETLEGKADLVDGKVPSGQLEDVVSPHNTSGTAHADIRGMFDDKADLVDGKVPTEQLPDGVTSEALDEHNESLTAHGDIRTAISGKADLVDGKVKDAQLPTGFTVNGLVAADMIAHNESDTAHQDIRGAVDGKADLVDGRVPLSQLPEDIGVVDIDTHNNSETAHADIRAELETKADLDNGVLNEAQIPEFLVDHLTAEDAHADIRSELESKADLVDGKVPSAQLTDVITPHDTSDSAHSDIRSTLESKANLVSGRIPLSELPQGIVISDGPTGNVEDAIFIGDPHEDWIYSTLPKSVAWSGVAYGNGIYVAIAYNSKVAAYSLDGEAWIETAMPESTTWFSVAYGDGKFVALAGDNGGAYSTDGVEWIKFGAISAGNIWLAIVYADGKFVALARDSSKAAYSVNGITWTVVNLPVYGSWQNITYGNGRFVAVSYTSSDVAYSTDGVVWHGANLPSSSAWLPVAYGGDKFVTIAYGTTLGAYSEDGENWAQFNLPVSANWSDMCYGVGKFVAISSKGVLLYSRNGYDWTSVLAESPGAWKSVAYDGLRFVLVRENSNSIALLSLTDSVVDYDGSLVAFIDKPNGVVGLDNRGKISIDRLPSDVTQTTEALIQHNVSPDAHEDIRTTLDVKADLVGGKVPAGQLPAMDYVPTSRTVNGKALNADIALTAADVSAVPTTRKVNNKALSADITLTAADVSAVPTTRKVNNKALNADIALTAADVGASNRNLLDNWDFRNPVNQRNVSSWGAGYGLDRWVAQRTTNINVAVMDGYVSVTGELNDGIVTLLPLKSLIAGETYTISILLLDGTVKSASVVAPQDISDFNGANIYSEWVCGILRNGNNTWSIYLAVTYAGTPQTINIQAAKLELGSVSTLANDPPADYGEELRKCQRYYVRLLFAQFEMIGNCSYHSTWLNLQLALPTPMRVNPTTAITCAPTRMADGLQLPSLAGVALRGTNANLGFTLDGTAGASGIFAGQDGYIDFSAEL